MIISHRISNCATVTAVGHAPRSCWFRGNPHLFAMASAGAGAAPCRSSEPAAARFESKFKKWVVSGSQEAGSAAVEVEAERTHTVVVTDCGPAHVVVQGKPKILLVDKVTAVGLVVEGCICGCEVVNCRDVKLSVAKLVPSLMVDKSSNISIVFPTVDALDTQIVWCNAEAVSVQFKAADDAEPSESDLRLLAVDAGGWVHSLVASCACAQGMHSSAVPSC